MSEALTNAIRAGLERREQRRKVLASGGCLHPVVREDEGGFVCQECGEDAEVAS